MHPHDVPDLTAGQVRLLLYAGRNAWISGPAPEYQGDLIHCSNAELCDLVGREMVERVPLAAPKSTEKNRAQPPYLTFTHRFRLTAEGRAFVANYLRSI